MINAGEYVFSSFIASINQQIDLASSANWTDDIKAVVAHEFLHCYQNCATVYGQMCIKHYGDVIASIATDQNNEIKLPLNPLNYLEIAQRWHMLRYAPEQDWESVNMILGCSIENIDGLLLKAIQDSSKSTLKQQVIEKAVVKVALNCKGFGKYILDGTALCDSMVAMIEEKIFPETSHYDLRFPYCLAKEIAKIMRPKINWDNDCLILLCDLCLDAFDPGLMFIQFFENIDVNIKKIDARDIYNYLKNIQMEVFSEANDQMVSMTWLDFRKKFLQDTLNSLDNLITNSFYQSAIDWVKDGLRAFFVIRDQLLGKAELSGTFFPYDWNWLVSMLSYGYPVYKVEPDTMDHPPDFFVLGNRQLSASVQWSYLDGLIRFLNFLGIKNREYLFCPFYASCRSTEKESCSNDPIRLYGLKNCQFQHYMSIFNLEKKQLIDPTGRPIK